MVKFSGGDVYVKRVARRNRLFCCMTNEFSRGTRKKTEKSSLASTADEAAAVSSRAFGDPASATFIPRT